MEMSPPPPPSGEYGEVWMILEGIRENSERIRQDTADQLENNNTPPEGQPGHLLNELA